MRKLKLLDLFSGIGGFSLGLERSGGFETVAFCEISPKCRHLLATHWPGVPIFEDVTTLTGGQVGAVDAICGGFPCQDISFAGKGAGIAGARSGLWREYARLISELRPSYVIVENVSALLSRGLGVVLGDLASLGYDAWWDCIPASAVGAPHRRDRLWIVAYPRGQQYEGYGDALRRAVAAELSRAVALESILAGDGGEADAQHTDSHGLGPHRPGVHLVGGFELRDEQVGHAEPMGGSLPHADGKRSSRRRVSETAGRGQGADPAGSGSSSRRDALRHGGQWSAEPDVGRVAHGVPARVDRLHGLGNAVVPQIPEIIGRAIIAAEAEIMREAA